jgi:hypothetical protein
MTSKQWPPPGFPLVRGEYALTSTWCIRLHDEFARRFEEGWLVLWRPGLTLWLAVWGNDHKESQTERLAWIKGEASPARFDVRESIGAGVSRFSYRLREQDEDGPTESLHGFVEGDDGHLQVSMYFDEPADSMIAQQLFDSIALRRA